MNYATLAINVPVYATFDYHVPPELSDKLQVGHLARVSFGTAMQPGIVLNLHDRPPADSQGNPIITKPVLELLDPLPVVNAQQIALAWWLSEQYLAPIGACLWLMLPPGIVGKRDTLVTLIQPDASSDDPQQTQIIDLLKRRGPLRGDQIKQNTKQKTWQKTVRALAAAGIVQTESVLLPPAVRRKAIQVASLAVAPERFPETLRLLGKSSREADLLEAIDNWTQDNDEPPSVWDMLYIANVGEGTLEKLIRAGDIHLEDETHIILDIPPENLDQRLCDLRGGERDLHILKVLAREDRPVDVSWVYAQTGAKLADLKRLEARGLIDLGEKQAVRDPLADRTFVPLAAPRLTPGQRAVWGVIRQVLDPLPASPASEGGEEPSAKSADVENLSIRLNEERRPAPGGSVPSPSTGRVREGLNPDDSPRRAERWYSPSDLWAKLKPLAQEKRQTPTTAERRLWEYLRKHQVGEYKFRRQHAIDRFIVDFYCHEGALIIEVDGPIHQYTPAEDAIRQAFLESLGFRVMRFTNEDVLNHIQDVLATIEAALKNPLPASPASEGGEEPSAKSADVENLSIRLDEERRPARSGSVPSPSTGRVREGSIFLLHGVTGSGKTEIYLRAIEKTLAQGKQAIFCVPEIALTAQTIRRVMARFPGKVAVVGEDDDAPRADGVALVHSKLRPGERYDTWCRARAGEIGVVVGTRSALFTPLPDVGLIILDEEHDDSYKQSPPAAYQQVFYHARDVAERMVRDHHGVLILGSATPDVETYYRAQRGDIRYLHLPDRIVGHYVAITERAQREGVQPRYRREDRSDAMTIPLPDVTVIDMRDELASGNTDIFSRELQTALDQVLARGEQAILFLNRRGSSTYVFCRDCGYVVTCPRCDMPMTYHEHDEKLHCHHCGLMHKPPALCPNCGSNRIRYFGAGTQHVEAALKAHFPQARGLRWDADTAVRPGDHDVILQRFINREADVLIGTQMIAKGLDLPLVTLVGVVSADTGLALPDFRAAERTFQLLAQVAGRAGRGLLGGRVILQTYRPEHYAIAAASRHDYAGFYAREIAYRRELGYPPFRRLVRILFRFENQTTAQREAQRAADLLRKRLDHLDMTGTDIIGPAPCFFTRLNRVYRWQVILRGPNPMPALKGLEIPHGWYVDVNPVSVL